MRPIPVVAAACAAGAVLAAQAPQTPVFRAGIDVVQLDVSVVDKDRHPVHGLTAKDFTVYDNGDKQSVVDVIETRVPDPSEADAAWLHLVQSDVDSNALPDRLRVGQVLVIAFDDAHLQSGATSMARARNIAYGVLDRMSGVDSAAVFSTRSGLIESFTNDTNRLRATIAAFKPARIRPPGILGQAPAAAGGDAGPATATTFRTPCEREDPTIPSLLTLTQWLAQIPQKRKTVVLISTGDSAPFTRPSIGCDSLLAQLATDLFWQAQRANINIHTFDPGGPVQPQAGGGGGPRLSDFSQGGARSGAVISSDQVRTSVDYGVAPANRTYTASRGGGFRPAGGSNSLNIIADSTGGESAARSKPVGPTLDRVFEANLSYYLVSYKTSHPAPDGKYRRVTVSTRSPGATALTRRGYFGPSPDSVRRSADSPEAILAAEASRMGISTGRELPLRATFTPFARPEADGGSHSAVAVTLGVRTVMPRSPMQDTIDIVMTTQDATGKASAPVRQSMWLPLAPGGSGEARFEISWRVDLPPGRHTFHVTAHSALLDRGGALFADVDVPDFSDPAIALSGLVFGPAPSGWWVMDHTASGLLPAAPTTSRTFAPGEAASVFCRVYRRDPSSTMTMDAQVLNVKGEVETTATQSLTAGASEYRFDLPTAKLRPGAHLVDIHATLADGSSARRMVPITIK